MIKLRRMRWMGHVVHMEERLTNHNFVDRSEDLGVDGRIILKWILGEIGIEVVDWIHAAVVDICECSNEPFGSVKSGELLD
jgi:redox-regulated HSP33 family molecular chaperone